MSVRADDCLTRLDGVLEGRGNFRPAELAQHLVHGVRLASNPPNQDGHPVSRLAAGALGAVTSVPSRSGELARALLRLQKVGFIDLQHACHALGLVWNNALEEPMPPPKRLV